jgi:membrane fusion protein (multidrug efflux system)
MRSVLIVAAIIASMILLKIFVLDKGKNEEKGSKQATTKGPGAKPGGGPPANVKIYIADKQITQNQIYATGTVIANEDVELRAETSGRLRNLYIREGTYVKAGQLIAKLNDADIVARIKKAKLEQDLATQIEIRQKKLLDINAISKEEYEIALNKVKTLSADIEGLEVAKAQTEVRAPFSGRIGFKNISIGAYITPSTIIARLIQSNPAKIDFSIPEKYSNKLNEGAFITFKTDDNQKEQSAKILALEPLIDEQLRTIKIRAQTPNNEGKLMPGNFVKVSANLGDSKSIMVPSDAIIPFLGGKKVFLIKGGKAEEKSIVTGLRTDKKVEVLEGVEIGDTIIISGIMSLKNGQSVKALTSKQ